jgi:hypothetical protein
MKQRRRHGQRTDPQITPITQIQMRQRSVIALALHLNLRNLWNLRNLRIILTAQNTPACARKSCA